MRRIIFAFIIVSLAASSSFAMKMGAGFKVKRPSEIKFWGHNCLEKIIRDDLRVTDGNLTKNDGDYYTGDVDNLVWDHASQSFTLYATANMTRSVCIQMETQNSIGSVTVSASNLTGSGTFTITGTTVTYGADMMDNWIDRDIQWYWARYDELITLNSPANPRDFMKMPGDNINSSHGPTGNVDAGFKQRPLGNKWMPDALIPIEAQLEFTGSLAYKTSVPAMTSQLLWGDYYIPREMPADTYSGNITITADGQTKVIPIQIIVKNHVMRDNDRVAWTGWLQYTDIAHRATGDFGQLGNQDSIDFCNNAIKTMARDRMRITGDSLVSPSQLDRQPCNFNATVTGTAFSAANNYEGPYKDTPINHIFATPFGLYYCGPGQNNYFCASGTPKMDYQQPCSYPITDYTNGVSDFVDDWDVEITSNLPGLETFIAYTLDEWGNDTGETDDWDCLDASFDVFSSEGIETIAGIEGRVYSTIGARWIMGYDRAAPASSTPADNLHIGIPCYYSENATDDGQCPNIDEEYTRQGDREFIPYNMAMTPEALGITEFKRPVAYAIDNERSIVRYMFQYQLNHWKSTNGVLFHDIFAQPINWGSLSDADSYSYTNGVQWGFAQRLRDGDIVYPANDELFPANDYNVWGIFPSIRLKELRMGIEFTNIIDHVYNLDAGGQNLIDANYENMIDSTDPDVIEQMWIDMLNYVDP